MAEPTPSQLAELAKAAGIVTGESLRRGDDYLFRSMGTPTNVFGRDLVEFGLAAYRRGLADGFRSPDDGAAAAAAEGVAAFAADGATVPPSPGCGHSWAPWGALWRCHWCGAEQAGKAVSQEKP